MTEKNRRLEVLDKSFDEIIKMGLELNETFVEDFETAANQSPDCPPPPADMLERIKKACGETEVKKPKRVTKVSFGKIVVIAAALVVLLSVVTQGGKISDILNKFTEATFQLLGIQESEHVYNTEEIKYYEDAEKDLGVPILTPTYLPEGFAFERIRVYPNDRVTLFYSNNDNTIKMNQKLRINENNEGKSVDEKDGDSYTLKAIGKNISISQYQQQETGITWFTAVWEDENFYYTVDGNCSKKEFEKFIKNLE